MAMLLIHDLKDSVKDRLCLRAAEHGRSMEAEVRAILEEATLEKQHKEHPYDAIRSLVSQYGPLDIELPPREMADEPPDFR